MDRISPLPDEILGYILSFLPTKQAVSTSLLSKRWRNVFLLVSTLDLHYDEYIDHNNWRKFVDDLNNRRKFVDDHDRFARLEARRLYMHDNRIKFMDFVDSLLSRQGMSLIKKFTLKIYGSDLDPTRVQNWICNVLERGVVDLNLVNIKNSKFLSSLIFKNNALVKLRLQSEFVINLSQDVYLPKLKTLCLDSVEFVGVHDFFETLLPRCPVLEELVIQSWLDGSFVSSRSLKKLIIRFFDYQTVSLDVPNLVYLELSCIFGVKYVNVNLDSLVEARLYSSVRGNRLLQKLRRGSADLVPADTIDIIIRIRNVRVLHLTSGALEMFYFSGQKLPKFDNLFHLCISSDMTQGWQILPLMIKNSPNLETLIFKGLEHYETTNCGDVCVCSVSKEKSLSCLSSCRIKVLEIWYYRGTLKEVNQMKHFLEKLPCLELVKVKDVSNHQMQNLLELPRASLNCKIQAIF